MVRLETVQEFSAALLTPEELQVLASLVGGRSLHIIGDFISVRCSIGQRTLQITPHDEAGRSARVQAEEVVRVSIQEKASMEVPLSSKIEVGFDAPVDRITVLQTGVVFGPPIYVGPGGLLGVPLPAGESIEVVTGPPDRHPSRHSAALHVLNRVDSALCFYPSWGEPIVVGTDGWGFSLSVAEGPDARNWIESCQEIAVESRLAD